MTTAILILIAFFTPVSAPDSWTCTNPLEVSCDASGCRSEEFFTPMSVNFDTSGLINVCAYSGCWTGNGKTAANGDFLIMTGYKLKFSTAMKDAEMESDIAIVLDKKDNIAVLKAGRFSHPLVCRAD